MTRTTIVFAAFSVLIAVAAPARAQVPQHARPMPTVNMAGPRFGMTLLNDRSIEELRKHNIQLKPIVSQFGWQFEKRMYANPEGLTVLSEWVPLITGLDQGVALPSLNWLAGLRTPSGHEFGIGPNISGAGVGLVIAGGLTVRSGALNIPMNVAVVTSRYGPRVTFLTGFNIRR
jgi:hypothetical protein